MAAGDYAVEGENDVMVVNGPATSPVISGAEAPPKRLGAGATEHQRLLDDVSGGAMSGKMASGEGDEDEAPPLRLVIVVTTTMFMGYAILVSFQHKLKEVYKEHNGTSPDTHEWLVGVSMLYIFNLIFRLAHNFIFAPIKPRTRVYVAMGAMCCSMLTLVVFVFQLKRTETLVWVYLAYGLGGVGIGSFESNLLSSVTPLGHTTKMWAVMGFPIGFASVLIGGFCLHAVGVPTEAFYYSVLASVLCGMVVYFVYVPVLEIKDNAQTLEAFVQNLRQWREWFPQIHWYCHALMFDMFFVSMFSSIMFYIYDDDGDVVHGTHTAHHTPQVPLFGPHSSVTMPKDWFFVVYNTFTMIGDSMSRRLVYHIAPKHPYTFLVLAVTGAALCLSKIAAIAPIGVMLVFACNGAVYASATRHIDTHVPKQFNLTSLSVWLFIGDIGSVTGSNTVAYVRGLACPNKQGHMCLGK